MTVDGKEITKDGKVVRLNFSASAPYKSRWSGETYGGYVNAGYISVDDNGVAENKSYYTDTTKYTTNVGVKIKDNKVEGEIIRYIGKEKESIVSSLVDKIISHCEANKINCPDREKLLNRTEQSLKDKLEDYGVSLDG